MQAHLTRLEGILDPHVVAWFAPEGGMFDCAPLRLASPMRVSSWGIGSARARVGAGFDPSGVSDRILLSLTPGGRRRSEGVQKVHFEL